MKVRDLIEALNFEDQNAEVHFAYSSGDYWKTVVAPTVQKVEEGFVEYSEYHRMPKLADEDEADIKSVVILS